MKQTSFDDSVLLHVVEQTEYIDNGPLHVCSRDISLITDPCMLGHQQVRKLYSWNTSQAISRYRFQVFDDKNQFAEWFGDSFGKSAPGGGGEDDVAMEKRVVVIHRLHQILEPFMLRRQVQDVEGKLPPKVTHSA